MYKNRFLITITRNAIFRYERFARIRVINMSDILQRICFYSFAWLLSRSICKPVGSFFYSVWKSDCGSFGTHLFKLWMLDDFATFFTEYNFPLEWLLQVSIYTNILSSVWHIQSQLNKRNWLRHSTSLRRNEKRYYGYFSERRILWCLITS